MGLNKRLIGAGATASGALTPSENFKAVTYTGDGTTSQFIDVGFTPDFVWIKGRNTSDSHNLIDSSRTAGCFLNSNTTGIEDCNSAHAQIQTNGFNAKSNPNANGINYVAWCWKANGGTTSSNTDGNITSTVQINADAGFSILTYSGTNNGSSATLGTGFDSAVDFVIIKATNSSQAWQVFTNISGVGRLELSSTGAQDTGNLLTFNSNGTVQFPSQNGAWNESGKNYVAYAFKSIDSFSKIGSYTGNGSTNGPIVETGFEPAFLMIKKSSASGSGWYMYDNVRTPNNPKNRILLANTSGAENVDVSPPYYALDFLSNGFQVKTSLGSDINANGQTFIYMAFAADPDTEAPTLASSFNIETYTGNATSNRAITGLGYKPNLVWIKNRSAAKDHMLFDSVRGETNPPGLYSNLSNAEFAGDANNFVGFDSDGFTIGQDSYTNGSGNDLVAWTWKADDNEPTIFGGPAKAVYKFEDNANDVTGTYNGNASNVSYVTGNFNKAASFNGSNSGTSGVVLTNLNDTLAGNSFSISLWVNCSSTQTGDNGEATIIGSAASSGVNGFDIMLKPTTGYLFFNFGNPNNDTVSTTDLRDDTWHHIVFTYTSSQALLYLDGNLLLTENSPNSLSSITNEITLGKWATGNYYALTGKIDQLRIYNGVVSDVGVAELYAESTSQNDDLELGGPPEIIISANANAGMSIVKWTGDGNASTQIPHGLSSTINMIISKDLSNAKTWQVYHSGAGSGAKFGGHLDSTAAFNTSAGTNGGWDTPTSTVLKFSNGSSSINNLNQSGAEIIAYCFHDISSYQKFGGYTGNGGNNRSITGLGFKPDFVMIKATSISSDWSVFDSRRSGNKTLAANENAAEVTNDSNGYISSFDSDGFTTQVGSSDDVNVNNFNETYIYWAVAKNVPSNTTLANSFKVVTYTGDATARSITGLGFKPDLVWLKSRNQANKNVLTDSARGANKQLFSDSTDAQSISTDRLTSFDTDGFSLNAGGTFNRTNNNGTTYVAWAWKAGNTWQSNIDGSIPSTVNANTSNGFSVVKYTGDGNSARTIGHGLTAKCDLVIIKGLDSADKWIVQLPQLGDNARCVLEGSAAKTDDSTTAQAGNTTVFGIGGDNAVNKSGDDFIAYCWHSVSGYSKIGTYSGNGSTGQTITTGFQPDFVIIKSTNNGSDWYMIDSVRPNNKFLVANGATTEYTASDTHTFVSTGFTLSGESYNNSGYDWIYMAFKMN